MKLTSINYKLAGMRKAQDFTIYPFKPDAAKITVQSDKAIGEFDPVTGEGVLNWRGSGAKYFHHLMPMMGAERFTFPREFVELCITMQPQSGDEIGAGVYVR